jgi:hypothetical protein
MHTKLILMLSCCLAFYKVPAQTLDVHSVVNLYFDQIGGLSNWQELKSYRMTQSYFSNHPVLNNGQSFLEKSTELEMVNTFFSDSQYFRIEYINQGVQAGVVLMDGKDSRFLVGSFENTMANYHPTGNTHYYAIGPSYLLAQAAAVDSVVYEGVVEAHGKTCHKLVFPAEEMRGKLIVFLDAETYQLHASSNINSEEKYKLYYDHRTVGDFVIPYSFHSYEEGELYEKYNVLDLSINENLDRQLFESW